MLINLIIILDYTSSKISSTRYYYLYLLKEQVLNIVLKPGLYISPSKGFCFAVYILLGGYKLQKILSKLRKTSCKQICHIYFSIYKTPEYRLRGKSFQVSVIEIDFRLLIGFYLFFKVLFQHFFISLQIGLHFIIVDSSLDKPSFRRVRKEFVLSEKYEKVVYLHRKNSIQ